MEKILELNNVTYDHHTKAADIAVEADHVYRMHDGYMGLVDQ